MDFTNKMLALKENTSFGNGLHQNLEEKALEDLGRIFGAIQKGSGD